MIRTEPGGVVVDPIELQNADVRGHEGRPWLVANFVATVDGATVVDGGSTAINDPDDKAMFTALRSVPDFIVVGAGTVRAENYRPVTLDEERRSARVSAGLEPAPHLVIVSRSLDLDPAARVFGDPKHRATILTDGDAPADRFAALSEVADVVRLKRTHTTDVIHYLRMARVVLCEGGPCLMGQFVAAGLVDELALTIAPLLVGGESPRLAHGPSTSLQEMYLDRVLYGDRSLFLRYVRAS
ncbi:MAG: dihydrofolate reductase family protein [Acidimicrobiia bacterium]